MNNRKKTEMLTRSAILLGLAILCQSIRLIIPMPPFVSVFIVGVLVNAILALSTYELGVKNTFLISFVLPFVSYMQGQLPVILFIPVIIAGNGVYIVVLNLLKGNNIYVYGAALLKAVVIYLGVYLASIFVELPPIIMNTLAITFGYAQIFTGCVGIVLARIAIRFLHSAKS